MFKSNLKKVLCCVCLILMLFTLFACKPKPKPKPKPAGNKINAVVQNEPDGYTFPKFDLVEQKFNQPVLTDEQMLKVVFEQLSTRIEGDENGNLPKLNYQLGEVYFSLVDDLKEFTRNTKDNAIYKCSGISSDIELSADYSLYKIMSEEVIPGATYGVKVNNAYWQQYFDVMLKNLEFGDADQSDYLVLAHLYGGDKEYLICDDWYVRTKQSDGKILKSDKKVDAPKICLVALLFEYIHKPNYYHSGTDLPFVENEITFHYNGKMATVQKEDFAKLGYEQEEDKQYKLIKTYVNERFLQTEDVVYVSLGYDKYLIIDQASDLYYVWNNFYAIKINRIWALVQYQNARKIEKLFDFSAVTALFK